jgi:iron(III) transport system ATP-binding protein
MAEVVLQDVTRRFGTVEAVAGLSLTVKDGEFFTLLGPSGCGKTTTLRLVAGFERPAGGEIRVGGEVYSNADRGIALPPEARRFGMVFQSYAVWPHLSVFDNVAFPLRVARRSRSEIDSEVRRVLDLVGLGGLGARYPHQLSGGQQQRVALARALVTTPRVLLLDEPLANLDAALREEMRWELKALQNRLGVTVLYVTHDQTEALALSDRIAVMRDGHAEQVDTARGLYERPASRFVFGFLGQATFLPVEIADGQVWLRVPTEGGSGGSGRRLDIEIPRDWPHRSALLACRPHDVELVRAGGLNGIVTQRIFIGDACDYRVAVGTLEVRVLAGREEQLSEGDLCGLRFRRLAWFPASDSPRSHQGS